MPKPIEMIRRITSTGQTTVPKVVRKLLGLKPGSKLAFRMKGDEVELRKAKKARG